jgi:hypothetical protein
MIRKFKFESDLYQSLACLPMAARRKLDAVGIKIGRVDWNKLGRGERLMICHAPADSGDEIDALKLFIADLMKSRCGSEPKILPADIRVSATPPDKIPDMLAEAARSAGVPISDSAWASLDADQRYALIKLGGSPKRSHNFKQALAEFIHDAAR